MKQHARQQHKPAAQSRARKEERNAEAHDAGQSHLESGRAKRARMQHGADQSAKRSMPLPAEDGHAAAHEGQLPQNQQRLGQHQNSRKQP